MESSNWHSGTHCVSSRNSRENSRGRTAVRRQVNGSIREWRKRRTSSICRVSAGSAESDQFQSQTNRSDENQIATATLSLSDVTEGQQTNSHSYHSEGLIGKRTRSLKRTGQCGGGLLRRFLRLGLEAFLARNHQHILASLRVLSRSFCC